MPYPREIHLDSDTEARLISYLNTELLNHYGERSQFVDDLKRFQLDYYAKPTSEKKTFPFTNAANIVIPLTAIAVEAIHARTMTTLFALDQFTAVKLPDLYDDLDHPLEQYFDHMLLKEVDMYKFADDCGLEWAKLGTCVGKSGWEKIERTAVKTIGDVEQEFTVTIKQGSTADPVPLANFLMPFSSQDPQTAPWCGEEHTENAFQVKVMTESGFFKEDTWERLENWVMQTGETALSGQTYRREMQKMQHMTPVWPKDIGWVEIWLSFNVDGSENGKEKEIIVHYHREAQFIMSCRYNFYEDLHRPYRYTNYYNLEHRWHGIGVCKQNEQFQREVTTQHRQRLDNATLANMRMIKVSKLSGYGPGEPVFPGKMWIVDDIKDIDTFQMGEVYPSSFNNESQTLTYAQQRTGVNELTLGMPQAGTPGTASAEMSRVQEGNRRFDYSYGKFKKFNAEISLDCICNNSQFGFRDPRVFDYINRGQEVKSFLSQDISLIRNNLIMTLTLAGQNQNKLQDRASWTQLAGFIQQYYSGMLQLAQATKDPNLIMQLTQASMSAGTEAFKQILESFDVRNINRIILTDLIKPIVVPPPANPELANQNDGSQSVLGSGTNQGLTPTSQTQGMGVSVIPTQELTGGSV